MDTKKFHSYNARARCENCDWNQTSDNAHGLAAQHHYATGHTVHVEVEKGYTMTQNGSEWHESWKQTNGKA